MAEERINKERYEEVEWYLIKHPYSDDTIKVIKIEYNKRNKAILIDETVSTATFGCGDGSLLEADTSMCVKRIHNCAHYAGKGRGQERTDLSTKKPNQVCTDG